LFAHPFYSWQFHPQIEQKFVWQVFLQSQDENKQHQLGTVSFHLHDRLTFGGSQKNKIDNIFFVDPALFQTFQPIKWLSSSTVLLKVILVVVLQKEHIHPCFSLLANLAQKADKLNSSQINYPPNTHTHTNKQSGIPSQR